MSTIATSAIPPASAAPAGQRYRFLLLMRYVILNATGLALLGAASLQGWVVTAIGADPTRLILVIAAVFAIGLVLSAHAALDLSRELNEAHEARPAPGSRARAYLDAIASSDAQGRATLASALKLKLANRIGWIRHLANSLVLLGLIGTVLGFIIALSGVDPASASDAGAVGPMVSTLIQGMSVALHTTLAGAVLNLWLMLNYRLLESGSVKLLTRIVEAGERHGVA